MACGTEPPGSLAPWERGGVRDFSFRKKALGTLTLTLAKRAREQHIAFNDKPLELNLAPMGSTRPPLVPGSTQPSQ